jgi:hypothetical protein
MSDSSQEVSKICSASQKPDEVQYLLQIVRQNSRGHA